MNLVNGISQSNCISAVPGSQLKKSTEHSILSITQVICGLPLYAFYLMDFMENSYRNSSFLGINLHTEWMETKKEKLPFGIE